MAVDNHHNRLVTISGLSNRVLNNSPIFIDPSGDVSIDPRTFESGGVEMVPNIILVVMPARADLDHNVYNDEFADLIHFAAALEAVYGRWHILVDVEEDLYGLWLPSIDLATYLVLVDIFSVMTSLHFFNFGIDLGLTL